MTKIRIIFDGKIKSSYIKNSREKINKLLQNAALDSIRARLLHTGKLSDEELLKWCTIEDDNLHSTL